VPGKARHVLTNIKIKNLIRKGGPVAVSDGAGLTLTISKSGYVAWVLRYRFGGKRKELTIGSFDDFPLSVAREQAQVYRQKIETGTDPAHEKRASKVVLAAGGQPETFKELAELWYQRKQVGRVKYPERIHATLENWIYPRLGRLPPVQITAALVVGCIEQVIDAGAPTTANDVRRYIKGILKYGALLGFMPANVASDIGQEDAGVREQARSRALSLSEIEKLFKVMAKERAWFGRDNELSVRLLLMLGVRKSELVGARWSEFDLYKGLWKIPKERSKTANGFTVPMPQQAINYLKELQIRACGSEWVFPARRRGARKLGHISPDTLNAAIAKLEHGMEPFTIHDLRRTMRTQLSGLGVRLEVAERCLNHTLKGMVGVYDRHDFLDQRREALQEWADCLEKQKPVTEIISINGLYDNPP